MIACKLTLKSVKKYIENNKQDKSAVRNKYEIICKKKHIKLKEKLCIKKMCNRQEKKGRSLAHQL